MWFGTTRQGDCDPRYAASNKERLNTPVPGVCCVSIRRNQTLAHAPLVYGNCPAATLKKGGGGTRPGGGIFVPPHIHANPKGRKNGCISELRVHAGAGPAIRPSRCATLARKLANAWRTGFCLFASALLRRLLIKSAFHRGKGKKKNLPALHLLFQERRRPDRTCYRGQVPAR